MLFSFERSCGKDRLRRQGKRSCESRNASALTVSLFLMQTSNACNMAWFSSSVHDFITEKNTIGHYLIKGLWPHITRSPILQPIVETLHGKKPRPRKNTLFRNESVKTGMPVKIIDNWVYLKGVKSLIWHSETLNTRMLIANRLTLQHFDTSFLDSVDASVNILKHFLTP